MRKQLSIDAFKRLAKNNELPDDYVVQQTFATEVEVETDAEGKAAGASRTLTFTISTPTVDRQGDTVSLDGWSLDNFLANPVVQWAHDYSMPPVARAVKTWKHSGKLKAKAEFVPADNPAIGAFAEGVLQLYKGGFLSAVSVGFMPRKWAWAEDENRKYGIDFQEQELLEFSCVPVPANPEALVEGRGAGIDIAPLKEWARKIIGERRERKSVKGISFTDAENAFLTGMIASYESQIAMAKAVISTGPVDAIQCEAECTIEDAVEEMMELRTWQLLAATSAGKSSPAPINLLDLSRRGVEIERIKASL